MKSGQSARGTVRLRARNVGGISEAEVAFEPGVTVLAGPNATNRTSLLRATMLALGSDRGSLKGAADAGQVEMVVDGTTYTRTLERAAEAVSLGGDPYCEELTAAELFAFLLGDNEARRAVEQGADLRELIVRPLDTAAIRAEIQELEEERARLDERIARINEREAELPGLRRERESLEADIEAEQEALADIEQELSSLDAGSENGRAREEMETALERLREAREELEQVRERITTESRSIDSLEEEREEVRRELSSFDVEPEPETTDGDIDRLRGQRDSLEAVVGELQSIIQFNEELLGEDRAELRAALDGSPTDGLSGTTTCWTCGSEIQEENIERTVERLHSFREEKLERLRSTEQRIEELKSRQRAAKHARQRREQLQQRLEGIDEEMARRQERREELRERRDRLEERLKELETDVERLEGREQNRILECHREANQHEFEIGRLRGKRQRVVAEIDDVETDLRRREDLRERREEVQSSLTEARTRIERVETDAVDRFNEEMAAVLELLEYGNVERVWIERAEDAGDTKFRFHVVRTDEEGTAYEDTVDHLSESEREVAGLVFALAGYLVHEVYEDLPFVLLDSLEAIDADRIGTLVDYFADYAEYTVVALLPEDAAAVDADHRVEFA